MDRPIPFKCLFCLRTAAPFTSVEHPIPESLGNDDTTLAPGFVCDQCNQYFGSNLERDVLASPPFGIERTGAAIKTKRGKLPKFSGSDVNLYSTGFYDRVIVVASHESRSFVLNANGAYLLVDPPRDYARLLARFLLKVGLELLVHAAREDPYSAMYDKARSFARYGDNRIHWPVAYGLYPRRRDLLISQRYDELGPLQTRQIYQYSMGVMPSGDRVLSFIFINHCFACNLCEPQLLEYVMGFNALNEFSMKLMRS